MTKKKEGHWETYYVCSICGEHSFIKKHYCPFCRIHMSNPDRIYCYKQYKGWCLDSCDGYDTDCERYEPCKEEI